MFSARYPGWTRSTASPPRGGCGVGPERQVARPRRPIRLPSPPGSGAGNWTTAMRRIIQSTDYRRGAMRAACFEPCRAGRQDTSSRGRPRREPGPARLVRSRSRSRWRSSRCSCCFTFHSTPPPMLSSSSPLVRTPSSAASSRFSSPPKPGTPPPSDRTVAESRCSTGSFWSRRRGRW